MPQIFTFYFNTAVLYIDEDLNILNGKQHIFHVAVVFIFFRDAVGPTPNAFGTPMIIPDSPTMDAEGELKCAFR